MPAAQRVLAIIRRLRQNFVSRQNSHGIWLLRPLSPSLFDGERAGVRGSHSLGLNRVSPKTNAIRPRFIDSSGSISIALGDERVERTRGLAFPALGPAGLRGG